MSDKPLTIEECKTVFIHPSCGNVGFYLRDMPSTGDIISERDTVFPDGSWPEAGQVVICGSCGQSIAGHELMTTNVKHKEAQP